MNEVDRKRKMQQELKTKGQKREETMITGKLVGGLFHKFGASLVASFLRAFLDFVTGMLTKLLKVVWVGNCRIGFGL